MNYNEYLKESHEFAINQAIERVIFEYTVGNKLKLENKPLSIENIKKLLAGGEVFTPEEYAYILEQAKKEIVKK